MTDPLISIILPVYNAAQTVAEALDSVIGQSEKRFELLAVENGSTDGSKDILQRYAASDPRIRLITLPRPSIVSALSAGLAAAVGRYIARMDADDIASPERLSQQLSYLERHPRCGILATCVRHTGDRKSGGYARYVDWTNSLLTHTEIFLNRFVESPLIHPTIMCPRDVLTRYGGAWREGPFPEDYELWLRLLQSGVQTAKLATPLLTLRDSPKRLSRTDKRYTDSTFSAIRAHYLAAAVEIEIKGRQLLIWGAGRTTRKRAVLVERSGLKIAAWIDIDPNKYGKIVANVPVISCNDLPSRDEAFVISFVGRWGARDDIALCLKNRGFECGRDFLMAA